MGCKEKSGGGVTRETGLFPGLYVEVSAGPEGCIGRCVSIHVRCPLVDT